MNDIRNIPKADLHNHFSLGGNREYIKAITGIKILYYKGVLKFMNDMHSWNRKLGPVSSICDHPIKELYRAVVDITINSDDILIFNSDVSKEYLRVYKNNVLS